MSRNASLTGLLGMCTLCMFLLAGRGHGMIHRLKWSPSCRHIAVFTGSKEFAVDRVVVFAVASLEQEPVAHRFDVTFLQAASWLPPKEQLCYIELGLGHRELVTWNPDGQLVKSLRLPSPPVDSGLASSPTGEMLALAEFLDETKSRIQFLSRDFKAIKKWPVQGSIAGLQWVPDKTDSIAVQINPGKVSAEYLQVINVKSGPSGKAIPMVGPVWSYGPGGIVYYLRSNPKVKRVCDVMRLDTASGCKARVLDGSKSELDSLTQIDWSPEARLLLAESKSGLVLVNLATGAVRTVWRGIDSSRPALAADGKRVAFVSAKNKVTIVELPSGKARTITVAADM